MVHEIAHGLLRNLFIFTLVAGAVIGGGTYLEPWAQEYEVKTAISMTCSDLMKVRHVGPANEEQRESLLGRLRRAQVKFKPENVALSGGTNKQAGKLTCDGKVVYDTSTPWLAITTIKPDLPPLKIHHVVVVKKEVSDRW